MPDVVKVKRKVPPAGRSPLSNVPSSLVTVWGIFPVFFQITVLPTAIVRVAGLKSARLTMITFVDGFGLCVCVGVGASGGVVVGLAAAPCPVGEGEADGVEPCALPNAIVRP